MASSGTPIWINGMGAITGYGWGRKYLWDGLVEGVPSARRHPGFDSVSEDGMAWLSLVPDEGRESDGATRFSRALIAAAREAVEDATERGWRPTGQVGIVNAVTLGDHDGWRGIYNGEIEVTRRNWLGMLPSTPVSMFMQDQQFHGPAMTMTAMCASGNAALLTAQAWITAGMCTDVVVVSTDLSGTPENVEAFAKMGVLIPDAHPLDSCRPFQEGSRGFVAGEASVAFLVSETPTDPYLRVLGGAFNHDAFHAIHLAPDGVQLQRCWLDAMRHAAVDPADVRYLNAHGPGTGQCDMAEAALSEVLLPELRAIYSLKPYLGHCQGAAAAIELFGAAVGYAEGRMPAPPHVADAHPLLMDGPTDVAPGITLKSSIGMGGYNSALLIDAP